MVAPFPTRARLPAWRDSAFPYGSNRAMIEDSVAPKNQISYQMQWCVRHLP